MELVKNYPWSENLKISQEDFKKWQSDSTADSFVFWSLKNKVINKNEYFNWAMEYYDTPFLEDMFFEQYLITKRQWNKMKDLSDWTKEIMPVAIWDNTVFIGCLELPQEKHFDFEHRFVLVSSMALQMTWKFTKTLSEVIKKDEEITRSQKIIQTDLGINKTDDFITESQTHSITRVTNSIKDIKKENFRKKDEGFQIKAFTPETPSEEKHPLIVPLVDQPSIQSKNKESTDSGLIKMDSHISKTKASLPEVEKERSADLENNTFPGRYNENDNLIMGNFKSKSSDTQRVSKKNLQTEITSTNTLYLKLGQDEDYETLWKQTKPVFCTSMVLKVETEKVFLLTWSGRMKINKTDEKLADLSDHSLFKVVQRGHPYHGFVVETSANKKFFNKIGWDSYPKHVTAIPIKNEKRELKHIFTGFSTSSLSKDKIKNVEKIVSDFFQSKNQKLSMTA